MKVEVAVLGSPSLMVPYGLCGRKEMKHEEEEEIAFRAQELCESRGGRPRLLVPYSPYGFCGRKATVKEEEVSGW